MKLVNGILRFTQLLAALALIAGYIFNGLIWDLVQMLNLGLTYEFVVDAYLIAIAFVVGIIPIRFVIEKIIESKFLL